MNKATNERKCIVCGGHRPPPLGKMVYCELCPRAYHHDCYIPPLIKVPRGKWYCHACASKAPPPKRRGPSKKAKDKDTKDSKDSKDSKDIKEQRDTKESSKNSSRAGSMDKKSSEAQRDNSIANSTADLSASETSINNAPVATTPQSTKSNDLSQSR